MQWMRYGLGAVVLLGLWIAGHTSWVSEGPEPDDSQAVTIPKGMLFNSSPSVSQPSSTQLGASNDVSAVLPAPSRGPELGQLLAAVRTASGIGSTESMSLRGHLNSGDQVQDFNLTIGPKGCYRLDLAGAGKAAAGFDGHRNWTVGSSDRMDPTALLDGRMPSLVTWVVTGAWAQQGGPCRVELVDVPAVPGRVSLLLSARHSGGTARLSLDARTVQPESLHLESTTSKEVWRFAEYRRALGVTLPHRLTRVRDQRASIYSFTSASPVLFSGTGEFQLALSSPSQSRNDRNSSPTNSRSLVAARVTANRDRRERAKTVHAGSSMPEPLISTGIDDPASEAPAAAGSSHKGKTPMPGKPEESVARMRVDEMHPTSGVGAETETRTETPPIKPRNPEIEKPTLEGL